jgi:CRISPR/Cas system-associated exonuclease Cas4 (RecB family)
VDCARLFQLRYLKRLGWPAPEVEPSLAQETHLDNGQAFHKLVQRYFTGIPPEKLAKNASTNLLLASWWRNFMEAAPVPDGSSTYVELSLSLPMGKHRLVARYDLVAVEKDAPHPRIFIYDWKTNRKMPKRRWLEGKLQTRVYPYVLARAGGNLLPGSTVDPDQIEMLYWFSNFPSAEERFPYSQDKFEQDEGYLRELIQGISRLDEGDFPRTTNLKRCRFCMYRSLCNRGVEAGTLEALEEGYDSEGEMVGGPDFDLDIEQVAEIEF